MRVDEDVVSERIAAQQRDAAHELRAEHETVVRFILHHVAHTDELRMPRQPSDILLHALAAQIHPADHAFYALIRIGEAEQPVTFCDVLPRLHRDAAIEAERFLQRREIRRKPVAMQRRANGNPRVLSGVVAPEMLMSVEKHAAFKQNPTGVGESISK